MIIKSIALENFRMCENAFVEFSRGTNLLYGKNAQGKTNMLEAIYFFARGKSFRTSKDSEIVRFGEKGFNIKIEFERKDGLNTLEYRFYENQRIRLLNGVKVSAREAMGKFNAVFFCPDHLSIIKAAPSQRREFLNIAISQLYGEYVTLLAEHKKLIEGKNALLKSENGVDIRLLQSYNEELSAVSAKIYLYRLEYIKELSVYLKEIIDEISNKKESAEIIYKSDIFAEFAEFDDVKLAYRNLFYEYEEREKAAKMSLVGIQRDDLLFNINGMDTRLFASQGQQRSLALALKIGEGEIIKKIKGEAPVYLFDDVLGELDEERKKYVLSRTENRQMIVTACEKGDYISLDKIKMIYVDGGKYEE